VEDGVELHRTIYDVAQIGGDFDYHIIATVEQSDYLVDFRVLIILDSENDLLNIVFLYYRIDVGDTAQMRHHGAEALIDSAVDSDEANEEISRIDRLAIEILIGLESFFLAAYQQSGEANPAGMDHTGGMGGYEKSSKIGYAEMKKEQHHETDIVVAIGANVIVEQEREEDNYVSYLRGPKSHLQFLQTSLAVDILVGALHGIENTPRQGEQCDTPPEMRVMKDEVEVVQTVVVDGHFAVEEEQRPRCQRRKSIPQNIL